MSSNKEKLVLLIHGYCRIESNDMNIIDEILSIIFEYHKYAQWSFKFKGKGIELNEDGTIAKCTDITKEGHSVRADFPILRGEIISWELDCMIKAGSCNFFGVISSKWNDINDFDGCPYNSKIKGVGVDDSKNTGYNLKRGFHRLDWPKPMFLRNIIITLKFIANWTEKQCKITIFYNGKKLNPTQQDYTILLPEIDNKYVWYPCVTPYNINAHCTIRYVQG